MKKVSMHLFSYFIYDQYNPATTENWIWRHKIWVSIIFEEHISRATKCIACTKKKEQKVEMARMRETLQSLIFQEYCAYIE